MKKESSSLISRIAAFEKLAQDGGVSVPAAPGSDTEGAQKNIFRHGPGAPKSTMTYGDSEGPSPMVTYLAGSGDQPKLMDSGNPAFYEKMRMICWDTQRDIDHAKELDADVITNPSSKQMLVNESKKIGVVIGALKNVAGQLKTCKQSDWSVKSYNLIMAFCNRADGALSSLSINYKNQILPDPANSKLTPNSVSSSDPYGRSSSNKPSAFQGGGTGQASGSGTSGIASQHSPTLPYGAGK